MEGEALNTLVQEQEKKAVIIKGKEYLVGKLTLRQTISLAKFFTETSKRYNSAPIDTSGKSIFDDILSILSVFSDADTETFVKILTNQPLIENSQDENFQEIAFEEITDLLAVVLEKNDIQRIIKNVKRIASQFNKIQK